MDAFPGYTYFNPAKKVLCVMQIVEDGKNTEATRHTVFGHSDEDNDIHTGYTTKTESD
jgi:hypothetical protein